MGFSEYTLVGNSMSLRLFPEIHFGFSGEPLPISSYFSADPPTRDGLGEDRGQTVPKTGYFTPKDHGAIWLY